MRGQSPCARSWSCAEARRAALTAAVFIAAAVVVPLSGGNGPTAPSTPDAPFTVDVAGERFTMRLTAPSRFVSRMKTRAGGTPAGLMTHV